MVRQQQAPTRVILSSISHHTAPTNLAVTAMHRLRTTSIWSRRHQDSNSGFCAAPGEHHHGLNQSDNH